MLVLINFLKRDFRRRIEFWELILKVCEELCWTHASRRCVPDESARGGRKLLSSIESGILEGIAPE